MSAAATSARTRAAPSPILAVFDLDGTLTRRDTLLAFLRFWSGTRFLLGVLKALPALVAFALGLRSRDRAKEAVLRAFLGRASRQEVQSRGEAFARERLPALIRPAARERLAWHRERGHRCVLITASPAAYAEPWGRAAGFDEVIATGLHYDRDGRFTGRFDGGNCRGEEKRRRLEAQFGDLAALKVFGYGDSPADRAFLERCSEARYRPFREEAAGNAPRLADLWKLMRPHQWSKNAFVLVGVVFGHAWGDARLLGAALLAAAAFCLCSSAVYVVNDYADRERDRVHPKKRNRPLASGRVGTKAALALAAALAAAGGVLAALAGGSVLALVGAYAAMNLGYSFWLKNVVILDVFIISAGFLLRLLAGTLGIGIDPSQWLLVCGLFLTLFLGFAKRRSEMISIAEDFIIHRKALLHYNPSLLDKLIGICAAAALLSYSLYTMSPETAQVHGTGNLIYTIPFVAYGFFRYLYLMHARHAGADTSLDVVRDAHLLAAVLGWAAASVALIAGA